MHPHETAFAKSPVISTRIGRSNFLRELFSKILSLQPGLISHPRKTTDKVTVLYI